MTDTWTPGVEVGIDSAGKRPPFMTHRLHVGSWRVTAHWPSGHPITGGPLTMTIEPDQSGDVGNGITTTVLRKVEAALVESMGSEEVRSMLGQKATAVTADMGALYEALQGNGPRSSPTYYRDLLRLLDALGRQGDKTPNQTIAGALGVSPETIRTQIKAARKRAQTTKDGE